METVARLGLIFEDRDILSETQKSEGLIQSWLLLKPQHKTISDVSSNLLRTFDLSRSCPNGIILSMDGFVLPPFESTRIFKDKDVIRVQRKGGIFIGQGASSYEEGEIVEKEPVLTNVPLLTNGEVGKESERDISEPEEEDEGNQPNDQFPSEDASGRKVISKKRKSSKKLQSPKKKRKRHVVPEDANNKDDSLTAQESCGIDLAKSIDKKKKGHVVSEDAKNEDDSLMAQESCGIDRAKSIDKKKKKKKKKKVSKTKTSSTLSEHAEREDNVVEPLSNRKRSRPIEENEELHVDEPRTSNKTRKMPSRSARRKKAKRDWLKEVGKDEKKEVKASNVNKQITQSSEKDEDKEAIGMQQLNQNNNADCEGVEDGEIVPVVVRPGHIRFEPLEEDEVRDSRSEDTDLDQVPQQNHISVDTFQWNGITSKKKGQKWGTEKLPSRRSDYKEPRESAEMTEEPKECAEITTTQEVTPSVDPIDFNKLEPFASSPKEGDMIAYRVLELSTTWTPELSSFRVGKTSWYNPESNRILLAPVPEYPISFEKPDDDDDDDYDDGDDDQAMNSLYGDDGSLEIDYSLLVDVRKIQPGSPNAEKGVNGKVPETESQAGKEIAESNDGSSSSAKEILPDPTPGKENVWDELKEAVNAKKAELEREENGWSESSGPWSRRAMRSSALGPTMAILRAKNAL